MRLTEKVELFNGVKTHKKLSTISQQEMVVKLGQLEDIEEELGIDLVTLFKALKNGIYTKDQCGVHYHKQPYNTLEENIAYFRRLFEKQWTEDYGKTWALTKEELL